MNPTETFSYTEKWEINHPFTQIPNQLIYCQGHLGLTDGELITLIQLISHWYTVKRFVYPGITRLANYSQKDYNTVQRRLMNLEKKGFLQRIARRGMSNQYDLEPGAAKLAQHSTVCSSITHKRGDSVLKIPASLTPIPSSKEYSYKRIGSKRISKVGLDRRGFSTDPTESLV